MLIKISRLTALLVSSEFVRPIFDRVLTYLLAIFCVMTLKNILFNTREDILYMLRLPPRTQVLLRDGVTLYFL